jgi:hypothetical protein
MQRRSS